MHRIVMVFSFVGLGAVLGCASGRILNGDGSQGTDAEGSDTFRLDAGPDKGVTGSGGSGAGGQVTGAAGADAGGTGGAGQGDAGTGGRAIDAGVVDSADAGSGGAVDARPDVATDATTDSAPAAELRSLVSSHDFGPLEVGVTSGAFFWQIFNGGGATTGALAVSNSDPTEVTFTNTCSTTLSGGAGCLVAVTFKPATGGPRTASLTVTATPGGSVTLTMAAAGQYRLTVTTTGTGAVTSSPAGINCGASCSTLVDPGPVTLMARTTNGSGSLFSGWSATACAGPFRDCVVNINAPLTVSAQFAPVTANLIFVTAATFPSNLGSAISYDAKCNQAATAAGLNDATGTAFIATTSDSMSLMKDRLGTAARGWIRMDGMPFADSQSSMFVGGQVFNSIRFDETGARLNGAIFFTGTGAGGTLVFNCSNWTTNGDVSIANTATFGASDAGPGNWLDGYSGPCSVNRALACMGKTRTATVAPVITAGKKIWQSSSYVLGMQSPDAKCLADRPSGVTAAMAFIALTNRAAASVLTPSAVYVRPDGTRVGTGAQLAAGGSLDSGIWQDFAGTYSAQNVFTGSQDPNAIGTSDATCANWTSQGTTGQTGSSAFDGSSTWWSSAPVPCTGAGLYPIYCAEL